METIIQQYWGWKVNLLEQVHTNKFWNRIALQEIIISTENGNSIKLHHMDVPEFLQILYFILKFNHGYLHQMGL